MIHIEGIESTPLELTPDEFSKVTSAMTSHLNLVTACIYFTHIYFSGALWFRGRMLDSIEGARQSSNPLCRCEAGAILLYPRHLSSLHK